MFTTTMLSTAIMFNGSIILELILETIVFFGNQLSVFLGMEFWVYSSV